MRLLNSVVLALVFGGVALAAPLTNALQNIAATKFDSYDHLPTDDEAARLDAFTVALLRQPNVRGYLVGYAERSIPKGVLLRRLYGDQRYLVELRGLERSRVVVVEGGYRDKFTIELWPVPNNAAPPELLPNSTDRSIPKSYMFDEECLECGPAVNLDLFGLNEGLKFFADALQKDLDTRAVIAVRRSTHYRSRAAIDDARKAKRILIRVYRIDATRITINLAPRRRDNLSMAEMWIVGRPLNR